MAVSVSHENDARPHVADVTEVDRTGAALRRLGGVILTIAVAGALTYAHPAFHRFRPWVPGDPFPMARLFQAWGEQDLPAFAGTGYQSQEQITHRVAEELGASVAANLGEAAGVRRGDRGGGAPTEPGGDDGSPAVRIDPTEYAGIEVGIEDPTGRGLEPFYRALLRTARREPGALTRVGHWGDSSIATDHITYTVRRNFQRRFGDGGHGFHLIARGTMPYSHFDVQHRAANDAFDIKQLVRDQLRDGHYGYGGVQARAMAGAYAAFGTDPDAPVGNRVSRFHVYFQKHPSGGDVRVEVDGGEPRLFSTRGPELEDGVEHIEVADGPHRFVVRPVGGAVRFYGVALERNGPGVVYDSLGMVGARARRLLNYDPDHIAQQIEMRGTNLVVLGFGGNESDDPLARVEVYRDELRRVIRRMRPRSDDLGCLVFAPLDQAQRDEQGRISTLRNVPRIVEAQRQAAAAEGCAFFDTFAAMGGEGAMERWYRSRPRLALGDFRHATPAGYEVVGNMFYKAILKGFAEWLARQPQ